MWLMSIESAVFYAKCPIVVLFGIVLFQNRVIFIKNVNK
jgi:hypothetical protein